MALLLKNGTVFLHVPKTAGSWVIKLLRHHDLVRHKCGVDHISYDRVFWYDRFHRDEKVLRNMLRRRLGLIPAICPNSPKFCFVREPLSWYVSYWRFMQSLNWRHWGDRDDLLHWNPLALLNGLGSPDFNVFIHNVNRARPGFVTELYSLYVRSDVVVGRQESIVTDMVRISAQLGFPLTLEQVKSVPPANKTCIKVPQPEWDPALRRETQRCEHVAYLRYGYPIEDQGAEAGSLLSTPA